MFTLVIGGAASGKSEYAEAHVETLPGRRLDIATMEPWDEECRCLLYTSLGGTATRCGVDCPLRDWIREAFSRYEGLVFVGAVGIAVRAIAPYVQSKTTDPAVVVVDEGGRFVIPLLSGHLGGANGLAHRIAAAGGGSPVITTATDGRGLFAVDSWAKEQNCHVMEPERIKGVSGKLLEGETIWMRCPWAVSGLQPEGVLLGEAGDCDVEAVSYTHLDVYKRQKEYPP